MSYDVVYRERLPVCSECDKPVASDFFYEINGEVICPECMEKYHKKEVSDYI